MEESSGFKRLKAGNKKTPVHSIECFIIGDTKVATLYVPSKAIEAYFGISDKTLINWKKKGLEKAVYSISKLDLFDISYVNGWKTVNVNPVGKNITKISDDGSADESEKDIEEVSEQEADRRLKIWKVKMEELKHKELLGELVRAEDVDRAMAEQAVLHKAQLIDDLDTLPAMLENKSKAEIANILENHYERRMKNLSDFISKEYEDSDVMARAIHSFIMGEILPPKPDKKEEKDEPTKKPTKKKTPAKKKPTKKDDAK